MVVTTRSAAKRHHQSTNSSINTIAREPVAAKRVCGKKKQDEHQPSVSNLIPPLETHTTTASSTSSVINVSLPTSTVKNKSLLVVSPSNASFPSSSLSDTLSSITEQDKPSENNDEKELEEETKWSVVVEHNHPPNHSDVKCLLVMQKIKERVTTEPTSVIRMIEDEYMKHHLTDDDRQRFLLPAAQASKFYKIRSKMLPPSPKSLDFEVPDSCAMTHP
ncbi:unnamed protein product [Rotaria magnacalcarata]|uniref:Uncharacterized protein n=1 Tax=Rotaria magnacalcarata TaxID=392030 RepID=A0A816C1X5_9BILA|nr:unnamed protein product [Rotaria magnacalcarata]CAF3965368.1 unnamed protein product [Rotaria magnacalcarata]CAF4527709.1 unnamed protein product [Rotaria magnacalcarata]